jgi:cysteine desulfurase/selenocysteine lyase
VAAFAIKTMEPTAIAQQLNMQGIAIRAGHHCAQPALKHYDLGSAARASLGLYNTYEDIDALVRAVRGLAAR